MEYWAASCALALSLTSCADTGPSGPLQAEVDAGLQELDADGDDPVADGSGSVERADGSGPVDSPEDSGDVGGEDGEVYQKGDAPDADVVSHVHDAGAADARSSSAPSPPPHCTEYGQSVSVTGDSPRGALQVSLLSVAYVSGFTNSTRLRADGTLGEERFHLDISANHDVREYAVAPGTYGAAGAANAAWFSAKFRLCSAEDACEDREDLASLTTLTIEEHVPPTGSPREGDETLFRGRVNVSGNGWALDVPFEIHTVCSAIVDL